MCGSVEHLKVNCPELKEAKKGFSFVASDITLALSYGAVGTTTSSTLSRATPNSSADAEHTPSDQQTKKPKVKPKGRIVKF